MTRRGRRASAFKHGLTAGGAREAAAPDVEELAAALLGASPPEPALLEAARDVAREVLFLYRLQRYRRAVEEAGAMSQLTLKGRAEERFLELSAAVKLDDEVTWRRLQETVADTIGGADAAGLEISGATALLYEHMDASAELRRLDDYERRALSRRRKALRRLDYGRIEVERALRGAARGSVPSEANER